MSGTAGKSSSGDTEGDVARFFKTLVGLVTNRSSLASTWMLRGVRPLSVGAKLGIGVSATARQLTFTHGSLAGHTRKMTFLGVGAGVGVSMTGVSVTAPTANALVRHSGALIRGRRAPRDFPYAKLLGPAQVVTLAGNFGVHDGICLFAFNCKPRSGSDVWKDLRNGVATAVLPPLVVFQLLDGMIRESWAMALVAGLGGLGLANVGLSFSGGFVVDGGGAIEDIVHPVRAIESEVDALGRYASDLQYDIEHLYGMPSTFM